MVLTDKGNSPVRILLVDDYEPYRQKIRSMLETRPELQVIGEALDGLEAVQKAEELNPDLILLDISLPHAQWNRSSLSNIAYRPRIENTVRIFEHRRRRGKGSFEQRSARIRAQGRCRK
jgi:chemotaxis response regulator CheB